MLLSVPTEANAWPFGKKKKKKAAQTEMPAPKKTTPYEKLFKDKKPVTAKSDFITLHKVGDKLYFEIPLKYLGREMLLASTVSEVSTPDFCDVGYKAKTPLHVKFTRTDSTVHLRQVTSSATTDLLQKAVGRNYTDPILYSYGIKAFTPDSSAVVIDITALFTTHVKAFDFFGDGMMGGLLKVTPAFKKEASYLDEIKAFEDNLSVKSVLSYGVSMGMLTLKVLEDFPFTATVTRSFLLLPEEKMTPRISDSRVGIFNSSKTRISLEREDQLGTYSVAHRWRLEPKDEAAYRRGELVEPEKPIVFYVDDCFPETWKAAVKVGIERWNSAFEKIGFKQAIRALDFPTDDPEFDPDNLKYSCVRYLPNTTANAMGPSWVDPATGEIVNASVIVYGNIIQLVNNWRFIQTAQIDPRVRTKKLPTDVLEESIAYVIAHEIGHCLGFMHNMSASAAYPVDSLRSANFTRQYGTTASIMDYARFNYVAQPTDAGVRLLPPDLGVYDDFLIRWNYAYIPGGLSEWKEKEIVEKWVDEKAGDPLFRYGRQQVRARYDPSAIEEDLGDDPQKASEYGIKNLKYILSHLEEWIGDDPDYAHRKALYNQLLNQYFRYVRNVMYNIGGIYLTEVKEGTPGEKQVPVPKARQKASLNWVIKEFRNMDWVDNPTLKKRFPLQPEGSSQCREKVAKEFKALIENVVLSAHYATSPYPVEEFMNDLYNATWNNLIQGRSLTKGDKILQQVMVDLFCEPLKEPSRSASNPLTGFLPSVEEILTYGLDESGRAARFAEPLRLYEAEHGRGSVAREMAADNRFGTPGYGWQAKVSLGVLDDSKAHLQNLAVRSRTLLRNAVSNTSGTDRTHYQSLLIKLNGALTDKL